MATSQTQWFFTRKRREGLYLTTENHFYAGNRANIWLIQGPAKDVVVDTGLGVCDLRAFLEGEGLISGASPSGAGKDGSDGAGASAGGEVRGTRDRERECVVVCTHNHFDHCGGAHHFNGSVLIHEEDLPGLWEARQAETLNYVKREHFERQPYEGFSALGYRVPPTRCSPLRDGERVELGGGHYLEVLHLPGHTKGSIALHYPAKRELFTGDFLYECGTGGGLLDWLPTSCVRDYVRSAGRMIDWLEEKEIEAVYPGHFGVLKPGRAQQLLQEYVDSREGGSCSASCMQCCTKLFFQLGCFRCCGDSML